MKMAQTMASSYQSKLICYIETKQPISEMFHLQGKQDIKHITLERGK